MHLMVANQRRPMFTRCVSLLLILSLLTPPGVCACGATSTIPTGHVNESEHDGQCPDHPEKDGGQEPCPLTCPSSEHESHAPACPAVKSAAATNSTVEAPSPPAISGLICPPRVPDAFSRCLAAAHQPFLASLEQPLYLMLRALLI